MKSSGAWRNEHLHRVPKGVIPKEDCEDDLDALAAELLLAEASNLDKKAKDKGVEAYFSHNK